MAIFIVHWHCLYPTRLSSLQKNMWGHANVYDWPIMFEWQMTAQWLPDDCPMTSKWLLVDCWMTALWLIYDCKMTSRWLPDDCQMNAGWLLDDCRMTAWWLRDDCRMTVGWLPDDCQMTAGWLPDDCRMIEGWLPNDCPITLCESPDILAGQNMSPMSNNCTIVVQGLLVDWLIPMTQACNDYLMTAWVLPNDCLMTVQLAVQWLPMTDRWLSDDCPMTD